MNTWTCLALPLVFLLQNCKGEHHSDAFHEKYNKVYGDVFRSFPESLLWDEQQQQNEQNDELVTAVRPQKSSSSESLSSSHRENHSPSSSLHQSKQEKAEGDDNVAVDLDGFIDNRSHNFRNSDEIVLPHLSKKHLPPSQQEDAFLPEAKRGKRPKTITIKDVQGNMHQLLSSHLVFRLHDLPAWRDKRSSDDDKKPLASGTSSITIDTRLYNPLVAHRLSQTYVYPPSNSLTQTDREYFDTIRGETGLSAIHIEGMPDQVRPGWQHHRNNRIKGSGTMSLRQQRQLARDGEEWITRQWQEQRLANKDNCSITEETDKTPPTTPGAFQQQHQTVITHSRHTTPTTTNAKTNTTRTEKQQQQQQPRPKFVYHRVSGSFAAFRAIAPAIAQPLTQKVSSTHSDHDDEPPTTNGKQMMQNHEPIRDVVAVQLAP